jgi:hypothetical protein
MAHVWSALQPANSAPHRQLADIWRALGEPEFAAMARQRAEALERQAEAGRD